MYYYNLLFHVLWFPIHPLLLLWSIWWSILKKLDSFFRTHSYRINQITYKQQQLLTIRHYKLNQSKLLKRYKRPNQRMLASSAKVSIQINQRIRITTPRTYWQKSFLIGIWLSSNPHRLHINLILPLTWNFHRLQSIVRYSGGLESPKLKTNPP